VRENANWLQGLEKAWERPVDSFTLAVIFYGDQHQIWGPDIGGAGYLTWVHNIFGCDLMMLHVLVVDDHLLVAQAVGGLLRELCSLDLVGVCGSAAQALLTLEHTTADLLVQDLMLPGESWETVARAFLHGNPQGRILILTGLADRFEAPAWLGASLLAVVDKSLAWDALIDVVQTWQRQAVSCGLASPVSSALPPLTSLSPREQRVFECLGQGLLNREVASELGLCVGTVESYRKAICSKLGVSGSELVRLAVLRRCLPSPGACPAAT